jgi:phosphoribosylanthranilate isomerase
MPVAVKFCGLTRPDDAEEAGRLGASFAGVIFAGGPRRVSPPEALAVLDAAGPGLERVGVFGAQGVPEIARVAAAARLDVVQLHADPTPELVADVRDGTGCQVWAVVRVMNDVLPGGLDELAAAADALLLDAHVADRLGGTGVPFDWGRVARRRQQLRGRRVVLAGGLTPDNVSAAISALVPDVVDVSSGVESAPGVKDHARMRAFVEAVRRAEPPAGGRC